MFFPMSWTSWATVPRTSVPSVPAASVASVPSFFPASLKISADMMSSERK